ncbi:MAG TPA: ATP-binding protein [Blastocatellia bacterium]|nr:ATP-binding protein [Blastocatellia bacterium]
MKPQAGTIRVTTRTMLLLFVAFLALVSGAFNLRDRLSQKPVPSDGVFWLDGVNGVVAEVVEPDSPAARAGVHRGDILVGINTSPAADQFDEITLAQQVQLHLDHAMGLVQTGNSLNLSYWIERRNDAGDTVIHQGIADLETLRFRETHNLRAWYLWLIGAIYLGLGIFFLLRQGRAPYVRHFFLICLLAFIAHAYSGTEELRTQFDKAVDLADAIALILLAPMFIHFAAIYPARYHLFSRRRWLASWLYLPAAFLIFVETWMRFSGLRKLVEISWVNLLYNISTIELVGFAASVLISAGLLLRTFRQTRSVVVRQQLKWVIWGMGIAGVAFAVTYLPAFFIQPQVASLLELIAITPLILIPLSLGYSIVRYRLTDVDVVMRRSFAYIIATLSVATLFGSVMAVSYEFLRSMLPQEATLLIPALAMSVIAMLFAPVKNWVQERIDRMFYGEKYDYRITLQDFGRTLSSSTKLEPLLDSLVQRLKGVFSVETLAIFIEDRQSPSGFRLARAEGVNQEIIIPDNFRSLLREHSTSTGIVRINNLDSDEDAESIDLFLPFSNGLFSCLAPCAVRSRVAAVIALGRTSDGALLSSEDFNLLRAISGYVAVAIENAGLLEDQAQRAKEMARLKEFNENIIESINVGVMVINLHGRITNWNGALEDIYGIHREQAIGRRILEVFQADMIRALRLLSGRAEWQQDEPVNIYKFRAQSADGRELTLNISLAALQSKTEEIEGTLVAIEDVTERVRLEEQLQQSDKLSSIGLLAAGVAHEVNTPLTGISSYSQMLMRQIPESDPRHQLLEKIYRQTSRASSIVNNLLNFSRVSDSRFAQIDLNRVIDDTIQLLEAQLRNTRIEVTRHYAEDLPQAPGNAPKLQQVFMNLILNARDAMPEGGQLEISTRADEVSVTISFRDTGIGIAPEHLAKIYDPFFTTKQIGKGTGLGLAVSYGIIQDHGGSIQVESRPGEGTHFHLTLPLTTARQQLATAGD